MGASGGGEKGKEASGGAGAEPRAGNELGTTTTLPPLQAPQRSAAQRGGQRGNDRLGWGGGWGAESCSSLGGAPSAKNKLGWAARIPAFNFKSNLLPHLVPDPAGFQAPSKVTRGGNWASGIDSPTPFLCTFQPQLPPGLLLSCCSPFQQLLSSSSSLHLFLLCTGKAGQPQRPGRRLFSPHILTCGPARLQRGWGPITLNFVPGHSPPTRKSPSSTGSFLESQRPFFCLLSFRPATHCPLTVHLHFSSLSLLSPAVIPLPLELLPLLSLLQSLHPLPSVLPGAPILDPSTPPDPSGSMGPTCPDRKSVV